MSWAPMRMRECETKVQTRAIRSRGGGVVVMAAGLERYVGELYLATASPCKGRTCQS